MADVFDRRRPDPQLGVFETLLILDREPVELDAHLERLRHSLGELFGEDLPPGLAGEVRKRSRNIASGKARVTASPVAADIEVFGLPGHFVGLFPTKSPTPAVELHSFTLPGGLGAHKWVDRSPLDAAQARLPEGALPLIVDRGGTVLEASRANVFAVRRGALFTPPLDGRILPGITRARVLEIAAAKGVETHETGLSLDDLLAADEVFLTGSVRGVEGTGALDGSELAATGEVTAAIAAELRGTWIDGRLG